jgi:NADH-quinone oxidoreductase subunit N
MSLDRLHVLPERYLGLALSVRLVTSGRVMTSLGKSDAEREVRGQWTGDRKRRLSLCLVWTGRVERARRSERGWDSVTSWSSVWGGALVVNFSTESVKLVLVWRTAGVIWGMGGRETRLEIHAVEYSLRMGFASLGLMVMSSANDRLSLYLGLEWQALILYVLAGFRRWSSRSTEASLKYFIQGSVMSGLYLFGAGLIYGALGTVNFTEMSQRLRTEDGIAGARASWSWTELYDPESLGPAGVIQVVVGLGLILSTRRFKLAAVPFHMWAPDVYEGSPTSSSLYFGVVPKLGILSLVIRVLSSFGVRARLWDPMVRLVSVGCRILAPLAARSQMKWKRFLAYSSISNVGLILTSATLGGQHGYQAVWTYGVIYALTVMRVWRAMSSVVKLESVDESGDGRLVHRSRPIQYIHELDGLSQSNPGLGYTVAIGILASAGLPPFAMFYAKRSVLMTAVSGMERARAVFMVRVSVVTGFYYLRVVKMIFFANPLVTKRAQGAREESTARCLGRLRLRSVRLLYDYNLMHGLTRWMSRSSGA